jgi:hypothetical protein
MIFEPKKKVFRGISSTNTNTHVPSRYQCVETQSTEVFWAFSAAIARPFQPLRHLRNVRHADVNTFHRKQETFLYEFPMCSFLLPTKTHNRRLLFGSILKQGSPFWLLKPASEYVHERLLPWLCCYLVIHTEDLLRPLKLFYFNLWPTDSPS